MDPEFLRVVIVVLIAGLAVVGTGTGVLYLIFRAYGGTKAGSTSHIGLIAALVAFILCLLRRALFSVARGRLSSRTIASLPDRGQEARSGPAAAGRRSAPGSPRSRSCRSPDGSMVATSGAAGLAAQRLEHALHEGTGNRALRDIAPPTPRPRVPERSTRESRPARPDARPASSCSRSGNHRRDPADRSPARRAAESADPSPPRWQRADRRRERARTERSTRAHSHAAPPRRQSPGLPGPRSPATPAWRRRARPRSARPRPLCSRA